MSTINKSKTSMSKGILNLDQEELLIPTKFFSKEEIKKEEDHYQYEKLRHNLKKKITETIIDKLSKIVKENENKKDIHVLSSLKTKSDSKSLYQRLKKINKRINEPHKLKACFINWLYKTPYAVEKRKRNKISKNDRNSKIINYFYHYHNKHAPNIGRKTTVMTTKKKPILSINTRKIGEKPKYKYNYSSTNSNVSYNKYENGVNDPNKGNIYIGKVNGDASYYHQKKYNNFGSLTIIQHNIDNTKKNYNKRDMEYTRPTNRSQEKRNELTVGSRSLRNSNSSSMIFMNSYGGSRLSRPQRSEDNRDNEELRGELPIDRQNKKIWTVTKEIYECKEVF